MGGSARIATPASTQGREAFINSLKRDSDPVAVLWELAIKEGYSLNSTIAAATVGENAVYTVTDPEKDPPQSFRACLDEQLAADIAKQLELTENDVFVCRDSALDDTLAANLALQCGLKRSSSKKEVPDVLRRDGKKSWAQWLKSPRPGRGSTYIHGL